MFNALWEIVIPLLLAVALGVLIGWWLWRRRRHSLSEAERATTQTRVHTLESRLADSERERSVVDAKRAAAIDDRDAAAASLSVVQSDLRSEQGRVAALEREVVELRDLSPPDCGHAPIIDDLERRVAQLTRAEDGLRQELDRARASAGGAERQQPAPVIDLDAEEPVLPAWQSGTTSLGTAGASHQDDLKVINGIGPKMESTLNSFGIQSWEQLAALAPGEVQTVDDALEDFPGRIERDQWVAQAHDLVTRFPDLADRPTRATYLNPGAK